MRQRTHIRDHDTEAAVFGRRVLVAMVIVVAAFVALASNMYHLQVSEHNELQTRSNDNRIKLLPLAPNRGLIYDRNGVLLAENTPIYSLDVTPEEIDDLDSTLSQLQKLLSFPDTTIDRFYRNLKNQRRFNNVPLLDDLNEQQLAIFAAQQHKYPGVSIEARLIRNYPHKELLTHAVGYVAKINRNDVEKLRESGELPNYAASRTIGKLGIEKYYEKELHGEVGYQSVEVNNRGRAVRTLSIEAPTPGQDIVLELDLELQRKAAELLGEQRGSIILMDATTGGILSMTSTPSYDPNWFVNGISVKQYQSLLNSTQSPLLNRVTQGAYPPASTVKPQIGLLGLEDGTITEKTRIWDPGWFEIKGVDRRYRDWLAWGHGWVDVETAITESCDTFYYDLALKLGVDKISSFMEQFGFGQKTGIDLHEEVSALMPSRGWKRARFGQPWYAGETLSVGIGQSYWTATPMQLAVATAMVANKGEHLVPRLLKGKIQDGEFEEALITHREPLKLKDSNNWEIITKAMRNVNMEQKGTAQSAFKDAPYSSAGKTGTAQVRSLGQEEEYNAEDIAERYRDNAMYVGYAPADDPKVIVVVTIENSLGGGGSVAAPVARKMLDLWHTRFNNGNKQQENTNADD
ncbi:MULTISPECIES: penicillin-binding protein 2 [Idiomarina]|jgi:penicillin-binding protein 2|uniref:Peptidoglycan D,D-transpeptidase MrdA n=2 Tax=Idiomarina abyssalis TaxID=86102 RepID=A0A8I1G3I6_9GAMM|nr:MULTISPECIES: penicillin-binding protein 2 [Idiomarina]MBJ7266913.1 penicillin-binding protein 2 [Idiomarina abyssalis]MBJ7273315.1 penicillin-binding protein 2 [Idiomarina abyssalis]MBJ7315069.1 penicillin-binding protein 2 [Idiomarina abyssalis]MBP57584.1 penicillin-binding protein 2 [Idiomarina sp.]MDA6066382.1 penicillin-binding protein 2 [Idiomarina abyssalis]|tara:strand:+ start:13618 stop:15513 length:1896 start_codon:yes stop_codon:yes gene_type:complete